MKTLEELKMWLQGSQGRKDHREIEIYKKYIPYISKEEKIKEYPDNYIYIIGRKLEGKLVDKETGNVIIEETVTKGFPIYDEEQTKYQMENIEKYGSESSMEEYLVRSMLRYILIQFRDAKLENKL